MRRYRGVAALGLTGLLALPPSALASNHREAPITALDHKADITDVYAFVSYSADQAPGTPPRKVTLVLAVDPLLEPANGPTLFPFDPGILYEIKVDNDQDAVEDVIFQVRFSTEYQLPGVFTAVAGIGDGAFQPGTSNLVVPPRITDLRQSGPQPAPDLHRHHGAQAAGARPGDPPHQRRRLAALRRTRQRRPAHDGLRGALQRRDLPAGERRRRSSPAPPTTPSGSTLAAPSTPPASARSAAPCPAC